MRRESAAFRCRRIVEAVPFQNGYVVESGKLTNQAIRIDIDGNQSITIPATTTLGQHSSDFVAFIIPR